MVSKIEIDLKSLKFWFSIMVVINISLIVYIISNSWERDRSDNYALIDPQTASMEVNNFLRGQQYLTVSYTPLKTEVEKITNSSKGHYGIYFEDLITGAWFGINERDMFVPASLLKTPAVIAIVKKLEDGYLSMETKLTISEADIEPNLTFGSLASKGYGYDIDVKSALNFVINESDNTAYNVLVRQLTYGDLAEAYIAMGLPPPSFSPDISSTAITPKNYMNILRALYYSAYLRRTFSNFILSLLSDTKFDYGIISGLPDNIKVAHKIGDWGPTKSYHDCGIIYAPNKPYMLCIMSSGTTKKDFSETASNVSRTIYNYLK